MTDSSLIKKAMTTFVSSRNLPFIQIYLFASCLNRIAHRLAFFRIDAANMFPEFFDRHASADLTK